MLNDLLLEYLNISRWTQSTSIRLKRISDEQPHETDIETVRTLIQKLDESNDSEFWLTLHNTKELFLKYIPDYDVLKYYLRCTLDSSKDKALFLSKIFEEVHKDAEQCAAGICSYGE